MIFDLKLLEMIGFTKSKRPWGVKHGGTAVMTSKDSTSKREAGCAPLALTFVEEAAKAGQGGWSIILGQSQMVGYPCSQPESYEQLYHLLAGLAIPFNKVSQKGIAKRKAALPAPIEIFDAGGVNCLSRDCQFRKSCTNHDTASEYRSEDGITPELFKDGEQILCYTQTGEGKQREGGCVIFRGGKFVRAEDHY